MMNSSPCKYEDGWRCLVAQAATEGDPKIKYVSSRSLAWLSKTDKQILDVWNKKILIQDKNAVNILDKQIQAIDMRHNSPGILGWFTRFYHRILNLFGFGLTKHEEQEIHSLLNSQNTQPPIYSPSMTSFSSSSDKTLSNPPERPTKPHQHKGGGFEVSGHDSVSPRPVASPITGLTVKKGPTNEEMDEAYEKTIKGSINALSASDRSKIQKIEGIIMGLGFSSIQLQRAPHSTGFRFLVTPNSGVNPGVLFEKMDDQYYLREYVTKQVLQNLDPVVVQQYLEEKCRAGATYNFLGIMNEKLNAEGVGKRLELTLEGLQIEVTDKDENADNESEIVNIFFDKSIENYETFCDHMRSVTNGCIVLPKFDDNPVVYDPNVDSFVSVGSTILLEFDETPKIVILFESRFANLLLYGNGDGAESDE